MRETESLKYLTNRLIAEMAKRQEVELAAEKIRRIALEVVSVYGNEAVQMFMQRTANL